MIYKIISNKYLRIALIFLVIQQIIVASSTYFIARLAQSFAGNGPLFPYMLLFAASLVVVYVPAYFCVTNTERAKYDAHKLYNDTFHTVFLGKTYFLSSDELQSTATTTLAQESNYTLEPSLIVSLTFQRWFLMSYLMCSLLLGF